MTQAQTLPPHLREAMLLARLRALGSVFSAGEAARFLGFDREHLARQCHRLTKAGRLERAHNSEAVTCKYRLTEHGHASADLVSEPVKTISDGEKVLAALSTVAFVREQTIRQQTHLPASVIDRELTQMIDAKLVHRSVDGRGFWYRRAAT